MAERFGPAVCRIVGCSPGGRPARTHACLDCARLDGCDPRSARGSQTWIPSTASPSGSRILEIASTCVTTTPPSLRCSYFSLARQRHSHSHRPQLLGNARIHHQRNRPKASRLNPTMFEGPQALPRWFGCCQSVRHQRRLLKIRQIAVAKLRPTGGSFG